MCLCKMRGENHIVVFLPIFYLERAEAAKQLLQRKITTPQEFLFFAWRRTQAVRERSAKPRCISSILIGAF